MKTAKLLTRFKEIQKILTIFLSNKAIPLFEKQFLIIKIFFKKILYILFKGKEENLYIFFKKNKKYIYPLLGGYAITLCLFYLMTVLIDQNNKMPKPNNENTWIHFLSAKQVEDLKTKDRRIPDKPKEPKTPPQTPKMDVQSDPLEKPKLNVPKPDLDLPKNFSQKNNLPTGFGASAGGNNYGNSDVTPIVRIEPNYPRKAAITGTEGFVILQFDITPSGTVTNISILQSSPPQIFNRSATQALQRWKYKPRIVNNKPVMQKGLKVQLDFKLQK